MEHTRFIDIQGFRGIDAEFIPKEVAIAEINTPIIERWIMTLPYSFDDLPKKSKRENNWLWIIMESSGSRAKPISNVSWYKYEK